MFKRTPISHLSVIILLLFFTLLANLAPSNQSSSQSPQAGPFELNWSPNGSVIAGSGSRFLKVWDASTGAVILDFPEVTSNNYYVLDIAWSPDSKRIAAASDDNLIRIWNVSDVGYLPGQLITTITPNPDGFGLLMTIDWHPNGQLIVSAGIAENYTVRTWNANTFQLVEQLAIGDVTSVSWRPDVNQNALVRVNENSDAVIFTLGTPLQRNAIGDRQVSATAASWNSNGSLLAVGYADGAVYVWNTSTITPTVIMADQTSSPIRTLDWNFDNTRIISVDSEGVIQIWNSANGALIEQRQGNTIAAGFSPTSNNFAYSTATGAIQIVPLVTCNFSPANVGELRTDIGTANGNGTPDTICLSPTGNYSMSDAPSGYTADGSNGLPSITSDITLIGNGGTATLARATGSPNFRILRVASGGSLTLNNVIVQGGNAGSSGGGGIRNLGTLTLLNGSKVQSNTAAGGGGIYNLNGTVNLSGGSQVLGNTSTSSGGGLYNNGGTVTLDGVTLSNNTANTASGSGGGIYNSNGNLTIQGSSTLSTNTARLGGGIYLTDTGSHTVSVDMSVSISSNTATNNGGGVYINNGTVTIGNASGGLVTVSSNLASNSGSGLYQAGGNLTLRYCTVSSNGSSTAGSGGGIRSASTLTISHCTFANNRVNTASGLGAGIYLNSSATVSISNSTISNDPATAAARNGAGLFVSTAATVNISASSFTGNRAQHIGGGLFVDLGNTANISTTTFNNNSAVDQGGAIANYGTLTLTTSNLTSNNGGGYGGALVNDNSTTGDAINQTCVTGNTATNGSAMYSFSATLNAENNWWGSTSGAGSSINANVDANPYLSSCPNG